MGADRWSRIEEVLDVALTRDRSDWPSVLDERCSGDPELRREVEALLARLDTAERFLDSPPADVAAALASEARERERSGGSGAPVEGRRIGAYRIVRQVGRGGMSRVFLADRADGEFEAQVAVKLLRPGLDSEIDQQRFRAERQILASLTHPNIARLLDGGVTDDGLPYLVMEYVEGQPLDRYCEDRTLGVRERLQLFLAVAEATQYAHRNLVVHRDLKPSNILVASDGTVKLLDFGLAKLLAADTPVDVPTTRTGFRWMTPEYAAPEQVLGQPVTTLTDVYQLGAVLHEVLTGRLPFGTRGGNVRELEQAVLDREPAPLGDAFRGDVDAIVRRALRKEPEARYASAQAMADDIRRHLSGHPVAARRQTAGYRARRFVRRHRVGLSVATAVVAIATVWGVTMMRDRARIRVALAEATLGVRRAEQVTDFMVGLFEAAEGGKALTDTVTARELLTRGVAQARQLSGQPVIQAHMLDVIGRLYTQLGEYDRARPLLEDALEIRTGALGEHHADVVTSLESLAAATFGKGDIATAVTLRRQALDARRRLFGETHAKTVDALFKLATVMHTAGDYKGAEPLFDQWNAIISRQPPEVTSERVDQLQLIGSFYENRGHYDRAEPILRDAVVLNRELYGDGHQRVGVSLIGLGTMLFQAGKYEPSEVALREAVALLRVADPEGHPQLPVALKQWGVALGYLKRTDESIAALREAVAFHRRQQGPDGIFVATSQQDLASALILGESYAEAEQIVRDAIRILTRQFGDQNAMVVRGQIQLGDVYRHQRRFADAEPLLLAGYRRFEPPRPMTRAWRNSALTSLVRLYEAQGRLDEAAKYRSLLESSAVATSPAPAPASR